MKTKFNCRERFELIRLAYKRKQSDAYAEALKRKEEARAAQVAVFAKKFENMLSCFEAAMEANNEKFPPQTTSIRDHMDVSGERVAFDGDLTADVRKYLDNIIEKRDDLRDFLKICAVQSVTHDDGWSGHYEYIGSPAPFATFKFTNPKYYCVFLQYDGSHDL